MGLAAHSHTGSSTRHFLALDGLRGIAALAVVTTHVLDHLQTRLQLTHAYLAVDFFFMLSGFVIAHAYDQPLSHGLSVRDFCLIRIIRLYPLIALGIVLGASSLLVGGIAAPAVLKAAAFNGLLLPTTALLALRPWAFPVNSPMWSLAFEVWINLIYAALFRYFTNLTVFATLLLGAVATLVTCAIFGGLNVGYSFGDYYLGIVRVVFPFFTGILLSRFLAKRSFRFGWAHISALGLAAILLLPGWNLRLYDALMVLAVFPAIIAVAALSAPNRVLDPVWRYIGNISYPLYALHYPLVVAFSAVMHRLHIGNFGEEIAGLFMVLACVGVAHCALLFYDLPLRRYLAKWRKYPQAKGAPQLQPVLR